MEMIAQAALSGWGISAAGFLTFAVAALALKGTARAVGATAGFALAAMLGTVAFIAADGVLPSSPLTATPADPSAAALNDAQEPFENPGFTWIAEADQLLNRGDDQGAADALALALEMFRSQDNLVGQGHVYFWMGRVDHFAGQADAARAHYAQALQLFKEVGSQENQARVLMAMGDLEKDTFQWDAAADFFREGRQIWANVPGPKSDPHVLLALETIASMPEGEEAAWAILEQAALILENLGDADGLGDVSMVRADLQSNLGDVHGALSDYTRAAFQYREAGNREREALATLRTAKFEVLEGHNAEAVMRLDRAELIFADVSDPIGQAMVELVHGDLARLLGDMTSAGARYAAAAEGLRANSDRTEATALLKLGQVKAFVGNFDTARSALEAAARVYAAGGDPGGESAAHLALGQLAAAADDPTAAREHWVSAADLARQAGDALAEGRALLRLSELALSTGDIAAVREAYDQADTLFAAADVPMGAVLVALGRTDLAHAQSETVVAATAYQQAATALAAFAEPAAEANRFLGLPPVSGIYLVDELDQELGGDEPDLGAVARLAAEREANLAAFPNHNIEGRNFLAVIQARVAKAQTAN